MSNRTLILLLVLLVLLPLAGLGALFLLMAYAGER